MGSVPPGRTGRVSRRRRTLQVLGMGAIAALAIYLATLATPPEGDVASDGSGTALVAPGAVVGFGMLLGWLIVGYVMLARARRRGHGEPLGATEEG